MRWLFGAHGQLAVGILTATVTLALWGWYSLPGHPPTVGVIFHVSMFYGFMACYGVIATALGFKATERVEAQVANVDHADEISVKS